jgi:hypothetical protein
MNASAWTGFRSENERACVALTTITWPGRTVSDGTATTPASDLLNTRAALIAQMRQSGSGMFAYIAAGQSQPIVPAVSSA